MVLYLPPGVTDATKGEWLPKPAPPIQRPTEGLPSSVDITEADCAADRWPTKWTQLDPGQKVENFGLLDRHFIYYHIAAKDGETVTVSKDPKDSVIALANGKLIEATDKAGTTFTLPPDAGEAVLLYENAGQGNQFAPMERLNGIQGVKIGDAPGTLEFSGGESDRGAAFSTEGAPKSADWKKIAIAKDAPPAPDALLTWYRAEFALPEKNPSVWVPWHLHLEAMGNGFIYLNGHCLGRYWQVGPQHDFYLPECWLNFGANQSNAVALDLRPDGKSVSVQAMSIAPTTEFAETR
jgi:hypothetical protein